jgi:hypothetical protein
MKCVKGSELFCLFVLVAIALHVVLLALICVFAVFSFCLIRFQEPIQEMTGVDFRI